MKYFYRILYYWLPPILWMGFIFFLSSNQRVSITHTYSVDFLIFKTSHMIEYSILYFLLFRGFYSIKNKQASRNKLLVSLIISILFSISDEIHQLFTPTREGTLRDVLIDTTGILIMYIYIKYNLKWVKKFL